MIFYTFALRGIYAALPQIRVQLQPCIETHDGPWSCKNGGPLGPKSSGMETADQQAKRVTTTNKLDACTWVKVVELRVRGGRRKLPTKITRGLRAYPCIQQWTSYIGYDDDDNHFEWQCVSVLVDHRWYEPRLGRTTITMGPHHKLQCK